MKPEAGQWWVNEKFGDKVYFIGRCANGIMVFQVEGNEIEHGDLDWSGWRLMQPEDTACDECGGSGEIDSGGCTPWMAPINVPCGKCAQPEPQPAEDPDDWVVLDPVKYADHVPRVGIDQFEYRSNDWVTQEPYHSQITVGRYHEHCSGLHRCRRRDLPKVEQADERWPKYWETDGTAENVAFIKQTSEERFYFVCFDGSEELQLVKGFRPDRTRKQLTEAEAMALLKKPEQCIQSFDCANGDHSDACPINWSYHNQQKPQPRKTMLRLWIDSDCNIHAGLKGDRDLELLYDHETRQFYTEEQP